MSQTQSQIYKRLQTVFDSLFLEKVKVGPDLSAEQVPEWDSLTHITLLALVEKEFKIRFLTGEVESAQNVKDFVGIIEAHLTKSAAK